MKFGGYGCDHDQAGPASRRGCPATADTRAVASGDIGVEAARFRFRPIGGPAASLAPEGSTMTTLLDPAPTVRTRQRSVAVAEHRVARPAVAARWGRLVGRWDPESASGQRGHSRAHHVPWSVARAGSAAVIRRSVIRGEADDTASGGQLIFLSIRAVTCLGPGAGTITEGTRP